MRESALAIAAERPDSAIARGLIARLDADLGERYPATAIHGLHPADVDDPGLVFLVARVDGRPAGCGALRPLEPGLGEVKRMFVASDVRGRGIGRALLTALERAAVERGCRLLRLETGTRQPEALALYRSAGYREIPPFGEYVGNPFSVCFEKAVA